MKKIIIKTSDDRIIETSKEEFDALLIKLKEEGVRIVDVKFE